MQHDEMIWNVISHQFCSFKTTLGKAKTERQDFCTHPYSVSGFCCRSHCPLANSRYATIREKDGRINLFIKTVERAHSPKNLWEKHKLNRNYTKALAQVTELLAYFPKALMHRNKQRLTKIHQYLIRMRKIKLKQLAGGKAKMVTVNRKIEQREERREQKALVAAKIESNVEKELVQRLSKGIYGDIYNFPELESQNDLENMDAESEMESESEESNAAVEYLEDLEGEESEEEDEVPEIEYDDIGIRNYGNDDESGDDSHDESHDESDDDSHEGPGVDPLQDKKNKTIYSASKRRQAYEQHKKGGARIEIEYEDEDETEKEKEENTGTSW